MAGGVGAAKFMRGLIEVHDPASCTAVVNVADDFVLHGLRISPDIDTVTYTLSDNVNPDTGWGRRDETWAVMKELRELGGETWFNLGDRDLATHLYRTNRAQAGAPLSEITSEVTTAMGIAASIVPVSDDTVATRLTLTDGTEIAFQDYFVARQHSVAVTGVSFQGADLATPAPGVLEALSDASMIVIAPSNPIVSIGPLRAVAGIEGALRQRREDIIAISPIVGGKTLKGPADRLMRELGHEVSAVGVAQLYRDLAGTLVVDNADRKHVEAIEAIGVRCIVTDTIMSDVTRSAQLATTVKEAMT